MTGQPLLLLYCNALGTACTTLLHPAHNFCRNLLLGTSSTPYARYLAQLDAYTSWPIVQSVVAASIVLNSEFQDILDSLNRFSHETTTVYAQLTGLGCCACHKEQPTAAAAVQALCLGQTV